MKEGNWLLRFSGNVYSQFGEDGIIEKIVSMLPVSGWCVEFGAWDGKHLSNTHLLLSQKGWSGVLIESDPKKYQDLRATYVGNERVICLNRKVSFDGDDLLDNILESTPAPRELDLLSIDIDGNDYHVWKSVIRYRPKIVVIEFNNTIPNCIEFIRRPRVRRLREGAVGGITVPLGAGGFLARWALEWRPHIADVFARLREINGGYHIRILNDIVIAMLETPVR